MSDFTARMFNEHTQLQQRIEKLKAFILSEKFDSLPDVDKSDLREQLRHMEGYFKVLSCRVSRQCG